MGGVGFVDKSQKFSPAAFSKTYPIDKMVSYISVDTQTVKNCVKSFFSSGFSTNPFFEFESKISQFGFHLELKEFCIVFFQLHVCSEVIMHFWCNSNSFPGKIICIFLKKRFGCNYSFSVCSFAVLTSLQSVMTDKKE